MRTVIKIMVIAVGVVALVCMTFVTAAVAQHRRDLSVLRTIAGENEALTTIKDKEHTEVRVACKLPSGEVGNCTALRYKISDEECAQLLRAVDPQKGNNCRSAQNMVVHDQSAMLQLGDVYTANQSSPSGLRATLIKLDKNTLWKHW